MPENVYRVVITWDKWNIKKDVWEEIAKTQLKSTSDSFIERAYINARAALTEE